MRLFNPFIINFCTQTFIFLFVCIIFRRLYYFSYLRKFRITSFMLTI
nr:MAG TPA_asm: hypothetical protein [Bacteriophage sp.]